MTIKDLNIEEVRRALDANVKDKFSYLPRQLASMEVTEKFKTLLINSNIQSDMFNIICCTGNEDREAIKNNIYFFKKKSLPFSWWVGFEDEPEWLEKELTAHGLKNTESELAMAAQLDTIEWRQLPNELTIAEVSSPETLRDFISVITNIVPEEKDAISSFFLSAEKCLCDPNSNLRFFIGYYNGKPIATSSVHFAYGVAGIFDVIVSPSMRGKGIGKAMTTSAMQFAKEHNSIICTLTATNDAKYLYEKIGFAGIKQMWVYN